VFVSDQNSVEMTDVTLNRGEASQCFAFPQPGVDKDASAIGFEQREIARTAGR
jgi:hypothetical protein